jgi:hypothetical protein
VLPGEWFLVANGDFTVRDIDPESIAAEQAKEHGEPASKVGMKSEPPEVLTIKVVDGRGFCRVLRRACPASTLAIVSALSMRATLCRLRDQGTSALSKRSVTMAGYEKALE